MCMRVRLWAFLLILLVFVVISVCVGLFLGVSPREISERSVKSRRRKRRNTLRSVSPSNLQGIIEDSPP